MRFTRTVARVPRTNARRPRRFSSAGWEELGSRRGLVGNCQRGPERRRNTRGESFNGVRDGKRERDRGNGRDCAGRVGHANRRRVLIAAITVIALVRVGVGHRHARHCAVGIGTRIPDGVVHRCARQNARPSCNLDRQRYQRESCYSPYMHAAHPGNITPPRSTVPSDCNQGRGNFLLRSVVRRGAGKSARAERVDPATRRPADSAWCSP